MVTVESLQDYKRVVGEERDRLVMVRFHATYCRACKAVTPHFYKLARAYPSVVFVDIPVTEQNAVLHQGLGVPSLPFCHLYHPTAGLVEEGSFTRKQVGAFQRKLRCYIQGKCALPDEEEQQEKTTDLSKN